MTDSNPVRFTDRLSIVQPLVFDRILTGFSLTTIYVKSMYKVRGFVRESMCPLPE